MKAVSDMWKDSHHVLHNKQEWSLRPDAKALREHPSLLVRLDRSEHNEIHRECPAVPLLGYHALQRTLSFYEPGHNTIQSVDNLMKAMEHAANHPKAHIIEKHLAELAIWSIDLQKPFIAEATRNVRVL